MSEADAVEALLEVIHRLSALAVVGGAVDHAKGQTALGRLSDQLVLLVLPEEEHHAVRALLGQIEHHLVAGGIDEVVGVLVLVDGTGSDLQQLRSYRCGIDRCDQLVFEQSDLRQLHLVIDLLLRGREKVGQVVLVVGGDVEAVLELVPDGHRLHELRDSVGCAGAVFPFDHLRRRADLFGRAHGGSEAKERRAQCLAVVDDEHLVPHVSHAVRRDGAVHHQPVLEVVLDAVDGLAALAGRVLEGTDFVDDQRVKVGEEFFFLFRKPDGGVVVRDVAIRLSLESSLAVLRICNRCSEMRRKLSKISSPRCS